MQRIGFVTSVLSHLLVMVLLTSCNNSDQGKSVYMSQEIGWSIQIPEEWEIVSEDKLQELDKKGLDAIESAVEVNIDYSGLKHLISFSKNKFNSFQSTIEPFDFEYDGEWEENNKNLKEILLATYKAQGLHADATEISLEQIGGLNLHTYEITIYSPKGDVILKQIMYSQLINGFDFGATINYNNVADKEVMLEAFQNSSFNS